MKKILIIVILVLVFSMTSCAELVDNIFGEDYEYDYSQDLIYEDSKVFDHEKDRNEEEFTCGTDDDFDDVAEHYDEFIADEGDDVVLINKEIDRDEFIFIGLNDDLIFEIEGEEAKGKLGKKYETTIDIKIEELDEDEIKEILEKYGIPLNILDDEPDEPLDTDIENGVFGGDDDIQPTPDDETEPADDEMSYSKIKGYWSCVDYANYEFTEFNPNALAIEFDDYIMTFYIWGEDPESYEYYIEDGNVMQIMADGTVQKMNITFVTIDGVEYLSTYEYSTHDDTIYYLYFTKDS